MDFDQTCTAILLRQRQELIRIFVTVIPFSSLHKGYDFGKWLVSTLSHWGMDEFWPNLHIGIFWPRLYYRYNLFLTIYLFKLVGGHTFSSENTVLVSLVISLVNINVPWLYKIIWHQKEGRHLCFCRKINSSFFSENRLRHLMQVISLGDNLHEMSKPLFFFFFFDNIRKTITSLSSAELAKKVVKVK